MGFIDNISTFGAAIDSLYLVVLIVTGVAFFLVEGVLIYFLIRYRHREGHKAVYTHGNRRVEILWTVVPGVMLFALAVYQYGAWTEIKIDLPDESEAVEILVIANQFEWFAVYPGPDGQLETADDIESYTPVSLKSEDSKPDDQLETGDDLESPINTIHVPVNQKVIIRLTSVDVLHSFFVPALRLKQDAVPGTIIPVWFEATQTGEYEIVCTELCGLGHYRMRGFLTVESETEFQTWLAELPPVKE
jgi:cytochrome c oxidase subunit 2